MYLSLSQTYTHTHTHTHTHTFFLAHTPTPFPQTDTLSKLFKLCTTFDRWHVYSNSWLTKESWALATSVATTRPSWTFNCWLDVTYVVTTPLWLRGLKIFHFYLSRRSNKLSLNRCRDDGRIFLNRHFLNRHFFNHIFLTDIFITWIWGFFLTDIFITDIFLTDIFITWKTEIS